MPDVREYEKQREKVLMTSPSASERPREAERERQSEKGRARAGGCSSMSVLFSLASGLWYGSLVLHDDPDHMLT
jgi:hypothetical protein